jgi:hypothetical protein
VFSTDEQQELRKIEDGLRAQDRGFGRRLTLQQGVLRWAAPGRQGFLLALALAVVAAVALLAFGTVVTRRLLAAAGAALMPGLPALMVIGAKARPGWNAAQPRRHGAGCSAEVLRPLSADVTEQRGISLIAALRNPRSGRRGDAELACRSAAGVRGSQPRVRGPGRPAGHLAGSTAVRPNS